MHQYKIRSMGDGVRVRWVHDEHHETRGSYGYETEEATRAAEDEEIAKLASGEWVVLGCIVEEQCGACSEWRERDSVWGVVIEPDDVKLDEYATWSFGPFVAPVDVVK